MFVDVPEAIKKPHIEVNEDGHQFQHPGYTVRRCTKCEAEFLCAATALALQCGDPKRDGSPPEAVA